MFVLMIMIMIIGVRARSDLGGGAVSFLPEICFLLPQSVRKKRSFTILKIHKTVHIRNIEIFEPHIIYVGLLDLVTNKNLEPHIR